MGKIFFILILILIQSQICCAICSEEQIDVNTADKKELVKITYIGEVRADELIELRPFGSIDDLIKIKGIGEFYLEKIKQQELACVTKKVEEKEKNKKVEEEYNEEKTEINKEFENNDEYIEPEIILLNPKDIKSEDDKKSLSKKDYAKYGFVGFCILLIILFILKIKNKSNKNEFE